MLPTGTLRFRIVFAFFAAALVVSGLVAGSTYALARTYLTRQRTDVAIRQSFTSIRFATEFLDRPERSRELDRLVSFLQARGTSDVLVVDGPQSVASSVSLTPRSVPVGLRRVVQRGQVAYVVYGEGPRQLAFGSPVPRSGLHAYFVYPLRDLDQTLGLLSRILLAVMAGSLALAGGFGFRLALRTIEPLRRASEAARRVAEGRIETRLEETGRDELGLLTASFNTMAEALQQRIARERQFVADASHELRTPLTALKTSVEYLSDHTDDIPERMRPIVELARDEVQSLERLIDDLLELSRVEAGGVQVARDNVDLAAFASEVVRRRAPAADVRVEAAEPGLVTRTDKARLELVVGNLLENAVVHGGRTVAVEVVRRGGLAEIVVSDAGPGIDAEDLPRIFERFWRADQARRRGGLAGAGLGLAIAKENAHVIGATLDVESARGRGTRFIVRLPLTGESAR